MSPKGTNISFFGQIHELYQCSLRSWFTLCVSSVNSNTFVGFSVVLLALKPVHKLTPHFHSVMVKVRIKLVLEAILTELSERAATTALLAAEIELIAHK